MHKGASQQLTEKHRGARRGRTGPKWVWDGWPRPAGPACFWPGTRPPFALGAYLFIASAFAGRHIHPFIRVAETKEKHREEADGHRKSSGCLGDGLGHALAAMV
jgi:hypothetical protein